MLGLVTRCKLKQRKHKQHSTSQELSGMESIKMVGGEVRDCEEEDVVSRADKGSDSRCM